MTTTLSGNPATPKYQRNVLNALHYQGNDWKRILSFLSGELKILAERLTLNNFMDFDTIQTEVGGFQNMLDRLNKEIEQLRYDIQADEEAIQKLVRQNACNIKKQMFPFDSRKLTRVKDLSASVTATQFAINQFLTKNI